MAQGETESREDDFALIEGADPEFRQMLGMFDVPAFARRGQDLEFAEKRLHERCRHERGQKLDMVRLRLKQWAEAVEGPESWSRAFIRPIDELWEHVATEPPKWGGGLATPRRLRVRARDLAASVERFNHRWEAFLKHGLNLAPINHMIDQYNRHYVFEKECLFRSAKLAARLFEPRPPLTFEQLLAEYPLLPLPVLA